MTRIMKKLAAILLAAVLLSNVTAPACQHIHDENCGYNPITEEGCTHDHTSECYRGQQTRDGGCLYCED